MDYIEDDFTDALIDAICGEDSITAMVKITCTATSTVRMSSSYNHLTLTASLYVLSQRPT